MKQTTLTGRVRDVPTRPYLVDWDADQGSEFSFEVLEFLRPYWQHDVVLAEWPVVGTRMRYDFVNLTRAVIVETDGAQHYTYKPHFHGNRIGYMKSLKRDMVKDQIAERNGFKVVRVFPKDLPLSRKWFADRYDVHL